MSGLMADTPLGHVVSVRCERDQERIRRFGPAERRIRAEWAAFRAAAQPAAPPETAGEQMAALERMIAGMFA